MENSVMVALISSGPGAQLPGFASINSRFASLESRMLAFATLRDKAGL
jgi:hypothetical protein